MEQMNQIEFSGIRLRIFLISSVCVGLPALVWAFRFLLLHRKIRRRTSSFILLLLISDLLQLLLSLSIVIYANKNILFLIWSSSNLWGFLLHQLVAIEGVLKLKNPLFSPHITILLIVFFILNIWSIFVDALVKVSILFFSFGTTFASLSLLAVSFGLTCKAPPTPAVRNTQSVFPVAVFTFVMLCLPFMVANFFLSNPSWIEMSACLMSLRVIPDPILCVMVCKENLSYVQTPETEPNADQTAG